MAQSNVITITELDLEYELPVDATINLGETGSYFDTIKKVKRLPFSKGEIYYSDDVWNFEDFSTLNVNRSKMKISFADTADEFKDDLKNFALIKILENKTKIQSIRKVVFEVRNFFNYAKEHHVYDVKSITKDIVKDYIQSVRKNRSINALRMVKTYLKDFYISYSVNFDNIMLPGIMALFEQDSYKAFKAHQEKMKTKDIPRYYFDKFLSACITMMNDTSLETHYRAAACVYVILSQTGLRIGEILGLRIDGIKTTKIFNGEEANYLEYTTWKRENGNNTSSIEKTYINKLSKQAFLTLLDIHAERRAELGMDYLYMGGKNMSQARHFPIGSENFKKIAFQMFVKMDNLGLLEVVNLDKETYPTLHRYSLTNNGRSYPNIARLQDSPAETLTFPDTQQFRFHCCTELYEKGVSLKYIQRFMSHLTSDMVRYHILPTKTPQENMEYSTKVLSEIVSGKVKILGDDKGLSERIQQFVTDNNFHVEKDMDAICASLAKKIPIRQKTGGVCIKSSQLRDCSMDAKTNEFYCAYGVCPNIFHFYYMVDLTYRQCRELTESISINRERGHLKQVQKEQNMLRMITKKKLLPELEELRRMVERDGIDAIYIEHPEVQPIIENYDSIVKEATEWIQ